MNKLNSDYKKEELFQLINLWFCDIYINKKNKNIISITLIEKKIELLSKQILKIYTSQNKLNLNLFDINILSLAIESGFIENKDEYIILLNKVLIEANIIKIKNELLEDKKIIQGIEAFDDLIKVINIIYERYRKLCIYYNLNDFSLKEEFNVYINELLFNAKNNNIKSLNVLKIFESNINIEEKDIIKNLIIVVKNLYNQKNEIENYIQNKMKQIAPNLTLIVGHLIGARLIYRFGCLKKLAMVSSSTIQIIGSEKSLFKHLRSKSSSPKHGIIYNHPLISLSPYKLRGKISRILSFVISLAAKTDYFSNKLNPQIQLILKSKIQKIKK